MSTDLRAGQRWRSVACTTEVIVVKATRPGAELSCGGHAMIAAPSTPAETATPRDGLAGGTAVGKRYVTADDAIEVLCTKAGDGTLAVDGVPLEPKGAKALPASD